MILEIVGFLLTGIVAGAIMGIIPGIHPNMVVLLVPLLLTLTIEPQLLLVFLVAMGISNIFVDFIPSLLFGAPDSESGLATMPGHRMLMKGRGHHAVRLAVAGGFFSVALCTLLLPLLLISIPPTYATIRPYTHIMLAGITAFLIVSERSLKKIFWAGVCFFLSGAIGLLSSELPVDRTLALFPILSGLFGVPSLAFQRDGKLPRQKFEGEAENRSRVTRSIAAGTAGGVVSGLLPGVGISSLAGLATIDRNDRSFLITFGSMAASNMLLSFLALWLIGNPRSGIAVAAQQLTVMDFNLFVLTAIAALLSAAISTPLTLFLSRKTLTSLSKINYASTSRLMLLLIIFLSAAFTGPLGLMLMATCACLGTFATAVKIKRGILMGVLILPTILFFAGL